MSDGWRCVYCETANTFNDDRCIVCDRARGDAPAPVTTEMPAADPVPSAGPDPTSRRMLWPLITAAAVALIVIAVGVIVVLDRSADENLALAGSPTTTARTAPGSTNNGSSTAGGTLVAPPVVTSTTTTTASTATTATTSTTTTTALVTTTSTAPPTVATVTTTGSPPPAAGGTGASSAPREGSWTAIFISCNDQAACARTASTMRSVAPAATLIAPGTYQSLRPFWIVAAGSFSTGEAAAAYCRSLGRTSRDDCFGRYLSQDPADVAKIVFPD